MLELLDAGEKLPSYTNARAVLGRRAGEAWIDCHHAATSKWARELLKDVPSFKALSRAEKEAVLDTMPCLPMGKIAHGTIQRDVQSITAAIEQAMTGVDMGNAADIATRMKQAYGAWDPTYGPKIWAQSKDWLIAQGAQL